MKFCRLAGRTDLLPAEIWGGSEPSIFLPELPERQPTGDVLLWAVDDQGRRLPLAWEGGLAIGFDEVVEAVRSYRAVGSPRPMMSYSPFHPHRLSPRFRTLIRNVLAAPARFGAPRHDQFPRWPIEPTLAVWNTIARLSGLKPQWSNWPNRHDYAVCLSHDVDTAAGQRAAPQLADVEEQLGLRSAWFLCPGNYKVEHGLWNDIAARGHEIACHGLLHDFKLPYLSPSKIVERLTTALRLLDRYDVAGFRSPAFLRTPAMLDAVARFFAYDSSIPDTVRLHGANGSASFGPYRLGNQVELPVTIPYDGELIALGMPIEKRLALWLTKVEWIKRQGGLVHFLTHPDPQFSGRTPEQALYRVALERLVADRTAWFALPRQVAEHAQCGEGHDASSVRRQTLSRASLPVGEREPCNS